MALIGNLTVTVTATTADFDGKMKQTRATLKLTQEQAQEVARGFGSLGTALTQTGTQAGASAQGLDKASASLKQVKKTTDEAASGVATLLTSFKGLAAGILTFQALKAGAEGLLDSAVKSQALTAAFTAIAGSAQEGQKQLDFVRATADRLGFSFTTLAGAYKGLSAAARGTTLEGAATRDIFTAVATASRVLQLSTQDTGGVLLALQQIISKGTVQSEELRGQIGERLPGAFGIAARAMGVTEKELSKLLETGQVASAVFIPKFAAQLQKEFAGGADAASKTFAAASERLNNAFARLGESVAQSGLLDHLGKMLDKLTGIIAAGPKAADALRQVTQAQTARDLDPLRATGFPLPAAGNRFLDELNQSIAQQERLITAAQTRITKFAGGNAANEAVQRRFVLAPLEAELRRLQADKVTLLQAIADAGAALAGQDEGLGSMPTSRYVRGQDLTKTLQTQADDLRKVLTDLDAQAGLAPGSAIEVVEEKVKALDKAIKTLQETLGKQKDLVPLLQGSGASNALKGANAAGLAQALPLIQAQAASYGLDPALVAAVAYQESRFDPRAVSSAGARGVMQLMPGTAAGLGVSDSFDLQQNLTGGMKYLQQLSLQFNGDMAKVLAAYNAGPGRVLRGGALPAETQAYVPAVLARQRAIQGAGPLSSVSQLDALMQERAGLQSYLDARKAMIDIEQDLQAAQAKTETEFGQQVDARVRETLSAFEQLKGVRDKYTQLPEERDRDRVTRLAALAVQNSSIAADVEEAQSAALVGIAMQEKAKGLQDVADASKAAYDAGRTYLQQLEQDLLRLQGIPKEDRRLAPADLPAEYEGQAALLKRQIDAQRVFNELTSASDAFADGFLSTIEEVTSGSIRSFKQFADSVIADLLRIVNQQFLRPALSQLFQAGLNAALSYFGSTAGAGAGTASALASTGPGADFSQSSATLFDTGGTFRAEGGPVMRGGFYRVGERGPETIVAMQNGYVLPNGATGQQAPTSVTLNVYGVQDAQSFVRSQGQIQRGLLQAFQQAQRAA